MLEPISELVTLFEHYKISAYLIPSRDQYFNEYPPESAQRLKYITNFSGSNGVAIIYKNMKDQKQSSEPRATEESVSYDIHNFKLVGYKGLFFTDGRYLEQSKLELDQNFFRISDINNLPDFPWNDYLSKEVVIGYDPKLFTSNHLKIFGKIAKYLLKVSDNLVDKIWDNKLSSSATNIHLHDIEFSGQLHNDKIFTCRALLIKYSAEALIITSLDSICWLLNLRANDMAYSPLLFGKVIITRINLYLFTNPDKIDNQIISARPEITILGEEEFDNILLKLDGKILVDENFTSIHIMDLLKNKIIEKISDPCQLLKACKNNTEISHAINFHIQDAVALCEFFAYIFELSGSLISRQTEYSLGKMLRKFRAMQPHYIMDSFPTICGFKENGAIIHYRATSTQAKKIVDNGLLLIDSGAQYQGCTTDVTRTFSIGKPTKEQKLRYTQVLKGHIALSRVKFPVDKVTGSNLDILARQFLWQDEEDYPHSTGHGVGSFLNVHEGPQGISLRNNIILRAGMIVSNEPGYYKTGEFGIRIENLMYVKNAAPQTNNLKAQYLEFVPLTLVPYAKELIDLKMLNKDEKNYIKQYYEKINQQIYPLLSSKGKKWLVHHLFL